MEVAKKVDIIISYVIDKIVEEAGHRVLRLPPYHCQYKPIKLIWAQLKNRSPYPRGGHLGHVPPLEPNAQRKNLRRFKDLRGPIQRKSPKLSTGFFFFFLLKILLRGSTTLNSLIFQLCFIILKMKLYVCRNLFENFREIRRKIKKL